MTGTTAPDGSTTVTRAGSVVSRHKSNEPFRLTSVRPDTVFRVLTSCGLAGARTSTKPTSNRASCSLWSAASPPLGATRAATA